MKETDGDLRELTVCEYVELVILQEMRIETQGNIWTSMCLCQLDKC